MATAVEGAGATGGEQGLELVVAEALTDELCHGGTWGQGQGPVQQIAVSTLLYTKQRGVWGIAAGFWRVCTRYALHSNRLTQCIKHDNV